MKPFSRGFILGVATTISAAAGCFYAFKRTVVEPIEEKEEMIAEHRRRAIRKMHSSHQG
ncbi:DUF3042 family protein [Liquorilactobacillus satsumensis]|uniref:DUF3042 domain-containing protein n=1 Tax=Liquorilactobacillus satsumensis DSM 16230 = JCM 12392 TaxID=1423801 RepID=A0A0R1V2L0_9LACO|nr:DUF3042 family protein [Liquorilactobacillus satsumensis]KRL99873.1 hypothetical protein FD50_GL002409 [Liquorilactobacillus satsumensis DSM 16230 = JCM 12392]MCC7665636.1 DUF3042 domain-containing protein [Liquorilactobacillus satsumensis]MCP9311848.1 DUF3042 family protein [Liquorilactobacillus satsumensis]MCP9328352.1 DUF3042 family protein [Liquorilactobacillus satsumensis]MCP9358021.1 DUF3042 family protein [Liquorilactobacillus satsumensis]